MSAQYVSGSFFYQRGESWRSLTKFLWPRKKILHQEVSTALYVFVGPTAVLYWDFLDKLLYSQTRVKCSRPISSLPGLQGHRPKAHYYFTF